MDRRTISAYMIEAASNGPRTWFSTPLKLLWAAYMLLTSFYCLLAFFPYTYYALIKSPVYPWMPWFAHQHARLFWLALLAAAAGYCRERKRRWYAAIVLAATAMPAIFILFHPLLPGIQSGFSAYVWSVGTLVPVLLLAANDVAMHWREEGEPAAFSLTYSPLVLSAILIALLGWLGTRLQAYLHTHSSFLNLRDAEIGFWSIVTHAVLCAVTVSVLNLIFAAAARTSQPRRVRYAFIGVALFAGGLYGLLGFLDSALGFNGWPAGLYAALLVATLLFLVLSMMLHRVQLRLFRAARSPAGRVALALVVAGMAALALILPAVIGEWDWNGVFQLLYTMALWLSLMVCLHFLWPRRGSYSVPAILAVLIVSVAGYKILQAADIFWAKSLGSTNDDIAHSLEQHASQDFSFRLAHHLLGNAPAEAPCEDFCRILKGYTNIRDAETTRQIQFVDGLVHTQGKRPNIFMIVVDSMRPDYLGAYNPNVNFTPNIDALAADSVVFRNTYTQYAGTYLSEPAIWSGAMLLHAHYVRPFQNVNGLEKLLNVDGYQMVVSFDNVVSELLSPKDDLVKLDTDKTSWRTLELCSTVKQLEDTLDRRAPGGSPVFFYSQPQNVHMFATNGQPTWRATKWETPGFNIRISLEVNEVDRCVGDLVSYLKARGLYDESIIIVTSDHGDATGEYGRRAHSYIIYPEVMRVPLIVHLPKSMQGNFVYDTDHISTLTDITPSLYYLLGHRPVKQDPMLGQPLFAETRAELTSYHRSELFLASDEVAVYGLLQNGRYMYVTYASPARSFLFDLAQDPNAEHDILTGELKRQYDQRVIDYLKMIGDYYGYRIGVNSLLVSQAR